MNVFSAMGLVERTSIQSSLSPEQISAKLRESVGPAPAFMPSMDASVVDVPWRGAVQANSAWLYRASRRGGGPYTFIELTWHKAVAGGSTLEIFAKPSSFLKFTLVAFTLVLFGPVLLLIGPSLSAPDVGSVGGKVLPVVVPLGMFVAVFMSAKRRFRTEFGEAEARLSRLLREPAL